MEKMCEPVEVDRLIVGRRRNLRRGGYHPRLPKLATMATSEDRTKTFWSAGQRRRTCCSAPASKTEILRRHEDDERYEDEWTMNDKGMNMSQQMDMNTVMYPEIVDSNKNITTLNYAMLRSPEPTTLPDRPGPGILF